MHSGGIPQAATRCALLWVLRALEAVEQSFAEAIYHLVWFMIRVNIVWLEESKCGLISNQLVKYCLMHMLCLYRDGG